MTKENFVDTVPNALILFNCFYVEKIRIGYAEEPDEVSQDDVELFWKIQALAGFMIWTKLFIFLRVFERPAFLVTMIRHILGEIGPFVLVLGVSLLAFTDAFYSVNKAFPPESDGELHSQDDLLLHFDDSFFYSVNAMIG